VAALPRRLRPRSRSGWAMQNKLPQLNARVPVDLIDELEKFCDNACMHKKEVVELAIRRFLVSEKEKVKNVSNPKNSY
jgi:hypothetical protein